MYGFIRSPVDERGSSWSITSRSRNDGTTFSIPITVTSTSGSVVHIRPFPSDSTTTMLPVSAHGEVRARDGHARAEECVAKERARRRRQLAGIVGETFEPEPLPEEVADLGPVLVDRGHEQVRGPLPRQLHDQLGQVGLERVNADRLERVVQPDLVGRERLHLHDLVHAFGAHDLRHDRVGLGSVPRPVDDAAAPGDRRLELDQELLEREERVGLDRRAGVTQLLPVRHLCDRLRPLRADRGRGVEHVRPHLPARQRLPCRLRERLRSRCPFSLRHGASTSAR